MSTLLGSRPCACPATLYRGCVERGLPTDWWGKANHFRVPLGREPGRGAVLLRRSDIDALDAAADHDLTFSGEDSSHRYTLKNVRLLSARCLTPGAVGDPGSVYLCELVEARRFDLDRIPADHAYNVSTADGTTWLAETINGADEWEWQEVVDDLCGVLGLDPAEFVLPFTPDAVPENLTYWGGSAWAALCDVLDRLACAAKYDPATDTFSVVRLGADDAEADATLVGLADRRTWDDYAVDPVRAWRPEKVRVEFLRRPRPTDGSNPYYSVDVTLAATDGVVAGSYVVLNDDLAAVGATGAPSNAASLTTRANERAADWLRKRGGYELRNVIVYRDFVPDVPGVALGTKYGEAGLDDRGQAMRTELIARPDGKLEGWKPLSVLPPWFPPDEGGGSSSLTVEEVDGSPSIASVTELRFDQADGFVVSQPGAGIARVDQTAASETTVGYVNLSDQVLGVNRKQVEAFTVGSTLYGDDPSDAPDGTAGNVVDPDGTLEVDNYIVVHGSYQSTGVKTNIWGGYVHFPGGGAVIWGDDTEGSSAQWVSAVLDGVFDYSRMEVYLGDEGYFVIKPNVTASANLPVDYAVARPDGFAGALVNYRGINGTRTVKDGSSNNKVVTIKGGIITDWET